jgi:signal transduction histidine kinase
VLSPDVKVKTEDFANIINAEEIQSLMDDFYELTHIGIAVVDMSGKVLVATGWQDICTKFHRIHPETKRNCIESDLYLSQHVKPGEYVKYKCKNNMWDIATPIVVGGKRMGTVFLGQFFYEDESIDYSFFEQQAERYGFDKNAYLEALEKVPRWNEDTISIVMDFYSKLSEIIAKLGYSNLKLAKMVEKHKQSEKKLQKAHQQLQEINKNLEDMVYQRTKELSNAIKIKDEFIHQLGHDLKTPLGPLISLLPIIKNHVTEPKDEEMITVIQRNVYYMKNLVKKTLELAQLNSPNYSLDFNSFSLKNLIGEVLEKNSSLFEDNNVNLINTISEDMEVYADKLRLVEVFDNLFSNSIKYAKNDVNVILSAEKQTDSVVISIRDDGFGLTSEQIKHVFDEFYKTDESRHDFESSGLGLPICRRIIEKHGGRIWVESEGPQRGSIFYFTLPLHP